MNTIKVSATAIMEFKGGSPAGGAEKLLRSWATDVALKPILSFAQQAQKKGEDIGEALERTLKVFHRDENGFPVIGHWMVKRCLITTGSMIFNAQKDRSHPKKDAVKNGIVFVRPTLIPMFRNGSQIEKPDYVHTVAMTAKRSFFSAYETIKNPFTFDFEVSFADEIISEEHISMILNTSGFTGLYAWRERFGKFKI